jgi:hypothetical protein
MVMAESKPTILGLWVDHSTTEQEGHNYTNIKTIVCLFLSPSGSFRIRTRNLRVMSQSFYHSARRTQPHIHSNHFLYFSLSQWQWQYRNPQSKDYEWIILPLCYQDTATHRLKPFTIFFSLPMAMAGSKSTILGLWVNHSTTVREGHNHIHNQSPLPFPLSQCQWLDSNPLSKDYESNNLPLCYQGTTELTFKCFFLSYFSQRQCRDLNLSS